LLIYSRPDTISHHVRPGLDGVYIEGTTEDSVEDPVELVIRQRMGLVQGVGGAVECGGGGEYFVVGVLCVGDWAGLQCEGIGKVFFARVEGVAGIWEKGAVCGAGRGFLCFFNDGVGFFVVDPVVLLPFYQ